MVPHMVSRVTAPNIGPRVQALKLVFGLWSCAVAYPGTCAADAPDGASVKPLYVDIIVVIWLQALVWAAFLLLPFAGQIGRPSKLHYGRSLGAHWGTEEVCG
jgi:hypothetical protein